jgi:hypothetical protein
MENEADRLRRDAIGLCGSCRHRREQASRRGSIFQRCARADSDPAFSRYPPLPVRRCAGHEPGDASDAPPDRTR